MGKTGTKDKSKSINNTNNNTKDPMIILNQMFAGGYITNEDKLGHEVINLFSTDQDKFYIWLNPSGVYTRSENVSGCTIVFVRSINSKIYKVLGKAINCKLLSGAEIGRKRKSKDNELNLQRYNKQCKISVTYKGLKPIGENGFFDEKYDLFATFEAEKVFKTNCDVYLVNGPRKTQKIENKYIYYLNGFRMPESMRRYIDSSDVNNYRAEIERVIENKDIWDLVKKFDEKEIEMENWDNFFKLIKKDKDELSISNALAYYIEKIGENKFLCDCLKIDADGTDFLDDNYEIKRERCNIDISFFGNSHVVIIENKIDADITKNKKDYTKQIKDALEYYDYKSNSTEYKDAYNDIYNKFKDFKGKASQLSKYYIYAIVYLYSKGVDISKIEKNIKCFLLIPNYSSKVFFDINKGYYKSNYLFSNKYKIITYDEIKSFFAKKKVQKKINDRYFKDFLSVLKPLASEFNNDIENETKYKFFTEIKKRKKKFFQKL